MIDKNKVRLIYFLLSELGWTESKEELVSEVSQGATESVTKLGNIAGNLLIKKLTEEHDKQCKPMRGKILHYMCLLGYTKENGKPDYQRIDGFLKNIGTRNPRKKGLYKLKLAELPGVVTQIEARYSKEFSKS